MLRIILKRMPGQHETPRWRMEFSEGAGLPFVSYTLAGDEDSLRKFLSDRLELPASRVSQVIVSLAGSNIAGAEVPSWTLSEARSLIRLAERETALADSVRQGKTVQPPAAQP